MNDKKLTAKYPGVSLFSEDAKDLPTQIQLMRTGKFSTWYDEFQITAAMFSSMVRNFSSKILGVDLAIDFGHQNWAEAAGWIKSLSTKNDGEELWAEVVWSKTGKEKVMGLEFRYLSAELAWDYQDNESGNFYGPTLLGAGLTNRPFIKAMNPTTELSEGQMNELEKAKAEVLRLSDEAKSATEKLSASEVALSSAKAENATLTAKLSAVETELTDLKTATEIADKKAKFDSLMRDGKAVEAQREAWMKNDVALFASLSSPALNLEAKGSSAAAKAEVTDVDAKIAELATAKLSDKINFRTAVSLVLKENPDLAAARKQ